MKDAKQWGRAKRISRITQALRTKPTTKRVKGGTMSPEQAPVPSPPVAGCKEALRGPCARENEKRWGRGEVGLV